MVSQNRNTAIQAPFIRLVNYNRTLINRMKEGASWSHYPDKMFPISTHTDFYNRQPSVVRPDRRSFYRGRGVLDTGAVYSTVSQYIVT